MGLAVLLLQDNPEYLKWSRFKAGSFVRLRMENNANGEKIVNELTVTLVELTKDKAVVETTGRVIRGKKVSERPAMRAEYLARPAPEPGRLPPHGPPNPAPDPADLKPKVTEGEEELVIGGKKVKCKWTEFRLGTRSEKSWKSEEVPGGLVKKEEQQGDFSSTLLVVEWESK
jgi:hypothetical protein